MIKYLKELANMKVGRATPVRREPSKHDNSDPLDPVQRMRGWHTGAVDLPRAVSLSLKDFMVDESVAISRNMVMDGKLRANIAMDDGEGQPIPIQSMGISGAYQVPQQLANWYAMQSFIGYQACAIIGQHWLVDKACTMPGDDAVRHGWELNVPDEVEMSDDDRNQIKQWDQTANIKQELSEFNRFNNIFGIRVALFDIRSDDRDYYAKPFNPDGITEDSYRGISQVDPYWMMPMLTAESTSDPSSMHFYEPEYWIISGRKYHRSHLIIIKGPEPADILKPTYIFGGIPLTQRIYERVYAAERTANEAPLLSLNKRTTAIHTDLSEMIMNQEKFEERLMTWVRFRDNHAVKVLGTDETMEQFDTSLSDFDSVIMNQYQIVAAISKVPSTKLLGTSPKGFNATGEFEMKSYHEELESIQEHNLTPLLNRHYMILTRSLGMKYTLEVVWNPVDSMTAKELADLNNVQSTAAKNYADMGAVSADEVRTKLKDDPRSGFNRLTDDDANTQPGMTPENIAAMQKAGAEKLKGEGALNSGEARQTVAGTKVGEEGQEEADAGAPSAAQLYQPGSEQEARPDGSREAGAILPSPRVAGQSQTTLKEPSLIDPQESDVERPGEVVAMLSQVANSLSKLADRMLPEGREIDHDAAGRTAKPSVVPTVQPRVTPPTRIMGQLPSYKLPKIKVNGMICVIENPRGTIRQGTTIDGMDWSSTMPHHYGYIKGVMGADGDELDCFVGPNMQSDRVYVINQNIDGAFDEHKCMLGFDNADQARAAYDASYQLGWDGFDSMVDCSMDEFKQWTATSPCNYPLTEEFLAQAGYRPMTDEAEFKEGDHPRADNGQFGSGTGGRGKAPEPDFKTSSPKWQAEIDKLKGAYESGNTEVLAKAAKKYGPDSNLGKYVAKLQGGSAATPKEAIAKIKAATNSDGDADTAKLLGKDVEPAPTMEIPDSVKREKATVSIASLIPTQDIVHAEHLEKILNGEDRKQSSNVPLIINYDGHDYIADGHHRVVAAKLTGEKDLEVNRVSIKSIDWDDNANMKVDWK